jgi:hypothetical protein
MIKLLYQGAVLAVEPTSTRIISIVRTGKDTIRVQVNFNCEEITAENGVRQPKVAPMKVDMSIAHFAKLNPTFNLPLALNSAQEMIIKEKKDKTPPSQRPLDVLEALGKELPARREITTEGYVRTHTDGFLNEDMINKIAEKISSKVTPKSTNRVTSADVKKK